MGRTGCALSVIGNANLDVIVHAAATFPPAGTEQIVPEIEVRLGGSAAIAAQRAAQLGLATRLTAKVGDDPSGRMVRALAEADGLDLDLITAGSADSGLTVVAEEQGCERSFLSSLGAMGTFSPEDLRSEAFDARFVLFSGYFLLPELQGGAAASLLRRARSSGATTVVDTGHPDGGWTERTRAELFEHVLPHTDLILPNESELLGMTSVENIEDAARDLAARTGGSMVVVKLGADGGLVCIDGEVHRAAAPVVAARDTTGAGDTFNAVLLAELSRDMGVVDALRTAVSTASQLVAMEPHERGAHLRGLRE